jgi:hypothetical protein
MSSNIILTKDVSTIEVNFDTIISEKIEEFQQPQLSKSFDLVMSKKYGLINNKKILDIIEQLNFEIKHEIDVEENTKDKEELLETIKSQNTPIQYKNKNTVFKMTPTFVEFKFSYFSFINKEHKAWFAISQEDFEIFNTYAEKVREQIKESFGNEFKFNSSLHKTEDDSVDPLGPSYGVNPNKILCIYTNEIADQFAIHKKISGKCVVALKTKKMSSADPKTLDIYTLEFQIIKIE